MKVANVYFQATKCPPAAWCEQQVETPKVQQVQSPAILCYLSFDFCVSSSIFSYFAIIASCMSFRPWSWPHHWARSSPQVLSSPKNASHAAFSQPARGKLNESQILAEPRTSRLSLFNHTNFIRSFRSFCIWIIPFPTIQTWKKFCSASTDSADKSR